MAEYIERERLIRELEGIIADYRDAHSFSTDFSATIVTGILNDTVKCQPVVDIFTESLRPVAHWEYNPNGMDFGLGAWECSRCKAKNDNLGGSKRINPYMFSGSKYCPNCGAKMITEVQNDA